MDIVFTAGNRAEIWTLPIVPNDTVIAQEQNNEIYEGLSMNINIIGNLALKTVEINSFFPVNKNYEFTKANSVSDGWLYVDFFQRWREDKLPIRIIITDHEAERLNMACTIDNFEYSVDKVGDINYTLSLKEYVFVV